ncbi:MAG: MFS transporter [Sphingomonadales bacterium]|nr:MFS transporter [Sphingomonadales bacterium]
MTEENFAAVKRPDNAPRLFTIAVLALFAAALSFSMRAALAGDIKTSVFDPINASASGEMIGAALGVAFLGFAITTFIISPLLDKVGMKLALVGAGVSFLLGVILTAFGQFVGPDWAYRTIWTGMLLMGIGWGFTEGTINPMTAALYPDDKTHRMNVLHAWWPAGLIIGGLSGYAIGLAQLPWYISIFIVAIPAIVFLAMLKGQSFPKTESHAMGVPTGEMVGEIFRRPSFLIWFAIMFLTASTELAPGQWVDFALSELVGMRGILLLVFVSGIMFVGRHFAGPIAKRISSVGLLFVSSILSFIGLQLFSHAASPATAIVAAAIWGMGVCFLWPTMLAIAAERYPRGGAWTIGLIASAGALAIYFVLPKLGAIYDAAMAKAAGGADRIAALPPAELLAAKASAAATAFDTVSIFPAILVGAFGVILLVERFRAFANTPPAVKEV